MGDQVRFHPEFGQRFLISVDVEEEFDWDAPFSATGHTLTSIGAIRRFQMLCEAHGIVPLYLVDWPVIASAEGEALFAELAAGGRADIGIQLHPWVNPPLDDPAETGAPAHSFAGNLPVALERAKFTALRDRIAATTGRAPIAYRAGRYGVGPNTLAMLADSGIRFDSSVRAKFDYAGEGGPDFRRHPLWPYWLDRQARIVELPLTTVFWGMLRRQGDLVYPLVARAPLLRSAMARAALLERIALTPEGISVEEAIRGIDIALDDGLPLLNFAFHSPSLEPGHTPYVRSEADVDVFYDWWDRVLAYLAMRRVKPASLAEIEGAIAG